MKIQQLQYVVATSKLGTMTAAAAELHIAQPALSRAVRSLEDELRIKIFEKDGRGLRLTTEGQDVVGIATRILAEVERLESLGHPTVLRVCATRAQARELAVPAVKTQVQSGERILLAVVDSREEVFASLRHQETDLGLVELPAPGELVTIPLGWQEFVLGHPPDWNLPDPFPTRDLGSIPLVAAPEGDWRHEALVSGLRAGGIEATVAAETSDRDLVGQLIAEGTGAAFLYGRQAAAAQAAGAKLTRLEPPPMREVGIAARQDPAGPSARFVAALRTHADGLLIAADDPRLEGASRISGPLLLRRSAAKD